MKFKKISTCFLVFFITIFMVSITFGEDRKDIFQNIVSETNGNIVENGMNISYKVKNEGKNECVNWLKLMNLYDKNEKQSENCNYTYNDLLNGENDINLESINKTKNTYKLENTVTINRSDMYSREFQKGNISGYIESKKYDNNTQIYIFIREVYPKEDINSIEKKVKKISGINGCNISVHKYIKIKSSIKDIKLIQSGIIKYLKNIGSENIDTVHINEGFSTVAYTKQYDPIVDNGKYIDLNFAVINESKQNFIILGTPMVDITY